MAYNLGTASGDIRIEYDNRGVARARNSLGQFVSLSNLMADDVDRDTKRASKGFDGLGASLGKLIKIMAITSAGANLLLSSFGAVQFLLQSLIPIAQAALGALPGLILAVVASIAVLKVALAGVGDAIKAAFQQDIDKFNEAIKGLAPAAQSFAKAVFNLVKELKPLATAIQQAFFANGDLTGVVGKIKAALAAVGPEAKTAAGAMGSLASAFLAALSSAGAIEAVKSILTGLAQVFASLVPAMTPFFDGFFKLAGQLGPLLQGFAGIAADALGRFGEFLGKVDLATLFDRAGTAILNLMELFGNLASIFGSIFDALSNGGAVVDEFGNKTGGATNALGQLVATVAEFLKSAAGQEALYALGAAIEAIASGGAQALLALLTALAPALTALAPLVTLLARVLGNILAKAFETLAPALLTIAEALNSSLGPILPSLMDAFLALAPPLARVASLIAGVLATALQVAGPLLSEIASVVSEVLVAAIEALLPSLEQLLPVWAELGAELLPVVLDLIRQLAPLFLELAPSIGIVAGIIVGLLVPAMQIMAPIFRGYIGILAAVIGAIATFIGWVVNLVGSFASWLGSVLSIGAALKGFGATAATVFSNVVSFARNMVSNVMGVFSQLAALPGRVAGYFAAMASAVSSRIGSLLAVVRGIPGQIMSAIGNLGGLLTGAGRDVIQGLINGIRSMIGAVASAARAAVAGIPGTIKNVLGISSPSKVTAALGTEISAGLAKGILDSLGLIDKAILTAASRVTLALPTNFAGSVSAAVTAATVPTAAIPAGTGTAGALGAGLAVTQNVYALPGMSPTEVAGLTLQKLSFGLRTGTAGI